MKLYRQAFQCACNVPLWNIVEVNVSFGNVSRVVFNVRLTPFAFKPFTHRLPQSLQFACLLSHESVDRLIYNSTEYCAD